MINHLFTWFRHLLLMQLVIIIQLTVFLNLLTCAPNTNTCKRAIEYRDKNQCQNGRYRQYRLITATPNGRHISAPSPCPTAIGTIPRIVVSVVINTGRKRLRPAVTTE